MGSNTTTKRRMIWRKLFYIAVTSSFILFFSGVATIAYLVHDVTPVKLNEAIVVETSFILDIKGEVLAQLHETQNRVTISIDLMPDHLLNAVVAMEDERFYEHFGFSPRDFIRGAYLTLTGQSRQGASTITQQVARNRILKDLEFTVKRKVQEIYLALQIEQEYSKKEILESYLNELFLGRSANGMQAAAQQYFEKDVQNLTLAESALLAGIIPSPNAWNPLSNFSAARSRQTLVLAKMVSVGYISAVQQQAALAEKVVLKKAGDISAEDKAAALKYNFVLTSRQATTSATGLTLSTYFSDYVARQSEDIIMKTKGLSRSEASKYLYTKGITIHTTLDMNMQRAGEQAMLELLTRKDGINDRVLHADGKSWLHLSSNQLQPQVSMLIIEPASGNIKVWIGGRDIVTRHGLDRINTIRNQPGSAIKPLLVYGPA
ncbi:MAG: transglycosylase domain-containing protein, partial [bacterium]|nr:transglycosylase domain-containing protein [bacterium]